MIQVSPSAEHSAESINLGRGMGTENISARSIAKQVYWRDTLEIQKVLQERFAASSLPFNVRLKIYTELMMVLNIAGVVDLNAERRSDIDIDAITKTLLPEMCNVGTC